MAAPKAKSVSQRGGRPCEEEEGPSLRTGLARDAISRMVSTPCNVKFGQCIGACQDVFMTIEFRAIEATCRRFTFNAYLLESQFLHDASAGLVSVEVADAHCLRAKVAERVPNSCVCRLRRHALSG